MHEIVEILYKELKNRRLSVPEFEELTGIPKDRVYKWKQQGSRPKPDDEKIIHDFLNKVPRETDNYIAKRLAIKNGIAKTENEIPMYFGNTRAGTIQVYSDEVRNADINFG